ncbi:ABC transporter substrate-binding protein [Clostridium rectalis]|uniref:ABC transporter substrate-binding protein n=1 Tax=Clostridium rectalis TaxID=2040295 RepID=UPI000F631C90|nr:extracellular solute-binding protein [Clostridium rectalis]
MRKFIISIIIFIISITYIGCGNFSKETEDDLKGSLTLVIDKKYNSYIGNIITDFNVLYPEVKIEVKNSTNIEEVVENTNNKNKADIIMVKDEDTQYILNKYKSKFLDISDKVSSYKNNFNKYRILNGTFNGKVYTIPFDSSEYIILYRKDIFSKINVDDIKIWNDYLEICKGINKSYNKKFYFMCENSKVGLYKIFLKELGMDYVDNKGKLTIESSQSVKTVELLKSFENEKLILTINSKEEFLKNLENNRIASSICSIKDLNEIMKKFPEMKGKFGVIKLPAFEHGGNRDVSFGENNFIINKDTENKNLAVKFLEFTVQNEKAQVKGLYNYGFFPSNFGVYKSEDFFKEVEYFNNIKLWLLASNIEMQSEGTVYTKNYSKITDILSKNFSKLYKGNGDIQKNLKDISEEIQKSIK